MFQLKYDENLNHIIRSIPCWKEESDIDEEIKQFIIDEQEKIIIKDIKEETYYCAKCMNELDEYLYCHNCNEQKIQDEIEITTKKDILEFSFNEDYYVFAPSDTNLILYEIGLVAKIYHNHNLKATIKDFKYNINRAILVEKSSFTDLKKEKTYTYQEYYESAYKGNDINEIDLDIEFARIYTNNLEELKNTAYKYTYIWESSNYLKENVFISLEQLLFIPLYFKNFELMMKEKLFALAFTSYKVFENNKTFEEIYKIDKSFIPFIKEHNMNYEEVSLLSLYKKKDISTIRFFMDSLYISPRILNFIDKCKIDLKVLKDYLTNQNQNVKEIIHEYFDYLEMAEQLGLDLKDKKVVYPEKLIEAHNELFLQTQVIEDPNINKKLKNLSTLLSLNTYEDNKYIICPATSIEDLIEESKNQHNCVRSYCTRYANNDTEIYFLRKKENPKESFVTVEVYNNKVVQAKTKYNAAPPQEVEDFLKKWEKTLIQVKNKLTEM